MSETYCPNHAYELLEFPNAVGLLEMTYLTPSCRECHPQRFVLHSWEKPEWLIRYWNESAEINETLSVQYGSDPVAGVFRGVASAYRYCARSLTTHLERERKCEA